MDTSLFETDTFAVVAQSVERIHGKDEVSSSILDNGSRIMSDQ